MEFESTFDRLDTEKNYYIIYVDDAKFQKLYAAKDTVIDNNILTTLTQGTIINFGVSVTLSELCNSSVVDNINIVSLKAGETDIITFESTNKVHQKQILNLKICCYVFAILFMVCAIILGGSIVRTKNIK